MKYIDKTTGATVSLRESSTSFLAVTANEAESIRALLSQRIFAVAAGREDDGVMVLTARSDAESAVEIQRVLDHLRDTGEFQDVVPAFVDADGTTRYALPAKVAVQFVGVTAEQAAERLDALGSHISQTYGEGGLVEVAVPPGTDIGEFIDLLNADPVVRFAEPSWYAVNDLDLKVSVHVAPSSTAQSQDSELETERAGSVPWNIAAIDVAGAWRHTRGAQDVVVCVVDGMPERTHEALVGRLLPEDPAGLVFSDDTSTSSHATNIAGLVVGEHGDYHGIAPGVRVAPLVVNLYAQAYARRAEAISFVAARAREGTLEGVVVSRLVLSCSWRTAGDVASVRTALADAVAAGVPVICSAGNGDSNAPHYPSRYAVGLGSFSEGVIPVAATGHGDVRAPYSNYGPSVAIAAPGGDGLPLDERDIECPEVGSSYGLAAGTSIAVPHVAGAVALMLSTNPSLTPGQIKSLVMETADPISEMNPGFDGQLGTGRLNVRRAVEAVLALDPLDDSRVPPSQPPTDPPPGSGPRVRIAVRRGPRVSVTTR